MDPTESDRSKNSANVASNSLPSACANRMARYTQPIYCPVKIGSTFRHTRRWESWITPLRWAQLTLFIYIPSFIKIGSSNKRIKGWYEGDTQRRWCLRELNLRKQVIKWVNSERCGGVTAMPKKINISWFTAYCSLDLFYSSHNSNLQISK
jgi:hypothetical protein